MHIPRSWKEVARQEKTTKRKYDFDDFGFSNLATPRISRLARVEAHIP